jgi:hypothetical protein
MKRVNGKMMGVKTKNAVQKAKGTQGKKKTSAGPNL